MNDYVGIWIDHSRAVIVTASAGHVTTEVVNSDVEPHPRYSSGEDAQGEKKYEQRRGQELDRYYDDIIGRLAEPDRLLILGPGEAKMELQTRLGRSKAHAARRVDIETTDKLTEPQIVARVREYFSIGQ